MAKTPKVEFKCDKCGKPQPKNEEQSSKILMCLTVIRNASVVVNSLCSWMGIKLVRTVIAWTKQ